MRNFDWQNIAVAFIIIVALLYVTRRGWSRVRSFTRAGENDSTCATGCGKCDSAASTPRATSNNKVLVQINRSPNSASSYSRLNSRQV